LSASGWIVLQDTTPSSGRATIESDWTAVWINIARKCLSLNQYCSFRSWK